MTKIIATLGLAAIVSLSVAACQGENIKLIYIEHLQDRSMNFLIYLIPKQLIYQTK